MKFTDMKLGTIFKFSSDSQFLTEEEFCPGSYRDPDMRYQKVNEDSAISEEDFDDVINSDELEDEDLIDCGVADLWEIEDSL